MNQKEFKALDDKFFDKLGKELDKKNASYKILQTDPFTGAKMVGISYNDSPNFAEVYSYQNNGDIAEWKFVGHTNI